MKLLRNDFFVTLCILAAYLLTNSYIYGWDDQHLELPLLKHLIDPSLYKGDYYVESLTRNFSSYLYPLLAKIFKISQIPAVYLILFLLARYVMFYWVFRLWQLIGGSRFAAAVATFAFFLMTRTEEFLYRTFSHQELSLALMMAGIYYFYRERYLLAAFIFGFAANIHAIYNLFPMLYMLAFLLFCHPKRWSMAFKAGLTFTLAALPFLCWQIPKSIADKMSGAPVPQGEWMPLYLLACPQNFLFQATPLSEVLGSFIVLFEKLLPYLSLTALYLFHLLFNPAARRDNKLHAVVGVSWALIGVSYYFHYVHPSRFVLDLNLVRVEQFVRFWLMGYTALWAVSKVQEKNVFVAFAASLLFLSFGVKDTVGLVGVLFLSALLMAQNYVRVSKISVWKALGALGFALLAGALSYKLAMLFKTSPDMPFYWQKFKYPLAVMIAVAVAAAFKPNWLILRRALIIIPLLWSFGSFCKYHYDYLQVKKHGGGFWQFQRNWEDMQFFVRDHTPKDAVILTPYNTDTGGFRIRSERKVLVCYRDCGIIGFDYKATVEWHRRVKDIENFKMYANESIEQALLNAILKYKVDYVVFMNYYQPKGDNPILKKLYQNEVLCLYQVMLPK